MEHHPQPPTIAILGADTVVGRSLSVLLEGSGYQITLLDAYPTGVVDELLFLGAMGKRVPQKAAMPVIALHTALEEDLPEKEGVKSVPWPCETKVLVDHIEAALLDAPAASAASTTSTTQARRK